MNARKNNKDLVFLCLQHYKYHLLFTLHGSYGLGVRVLNFEKEFGFGFLVAGLHHSRNGTLVPILHGRFIHGFEFVL